MANDLNASNLLNEYFSLLDEYKESGKEGNFYYLRLMNTRNKIYSENRSASNEEKKQMDECIKKAKYWQDKNYELYEKIKDMNKLLVRELPPIKTDGVVDLRKKIVTKEEEIISDYDLYLHGTDQLIGNMKYSGYHAGPSGDIAYSIEPEYRGNHYANRGLCLMSELLHDHNIEDFWVSIYKDNTPSIKTIERYGAVPIRETDEGVVVYQGTTAKIKDVTTGIKM